MAALTDPPSKPPRDKATTGGAEISTLLQPKQEQREAVLQGGTSTSLPCMQAPNIALPAGPGSLMGWEEMGSLKRWDETAVSGRASNQRLGQRQLPGSITARGQSPDKAPM